MGPVHNEQYLHTINAGGIGTSGRECQAGRSGGSGKEGALRSSTIAVMACFLQLIGRSGPGRLSRISIYFLTAF
ncbi:hypothetical protein EBB07_21430 [Paenibacillaceae bacterium]|nr:hypothetical protein EBB07_21430 [Paenibacillaceae bacterium]